MQELDFMNTKHVKYEYIILYVKW